MKWGGRNKMEKERGKVEIRRGKEEGKGRGKSREKMKGKMCRIGVRREKEKRRGKRASHAPLPPPTPALVICPTSYHPIPPGTGNPSLPLLSPRLHRVSRWPFPHSLHTRPATGGGLVYCTVLYLWSQIPIQQHPSQSTTLWLPSPESQRTGNQVLPLKL
ncbi:hypothetical protein Pcinc_026073 [Petrolisthes cinctipes]|uniref:Uncharacterized protein n=1 Tax=Petrolisthes cinctipes TaxID=88211 RepID=A0AAE1F790_PETCI|nr:hypothetical protein Pcinc_026073 [Petrolisthes cinctipes]